jgi:N-acetyl-anhydromuramyl-L-alanine amidase AmpD
MGMLPDLADACRKSGLTVVELDGWATRTRPASAGGFDPRGVLVHHTGGASDTKEYAYWMAATGRSDLPAPLCQLALDRSGTVYVCAAGRANHGGSAKATGPMPAGDANALYVGIEAMNTGSEGWTRTQYDAYVALCAALCAHYGWPATHVRAHRETSSTGKWDPGLLDMDKFRTDIANTLEDDMPKYRDWEKPDRDALANDVVTALVNYKFEVGEKSKWSFSTALGALVKRTKP